MWLMEKNLLSMFLQNNKKSNVENYCFQSSHLIPHTPTKNPNFNFRWIEVIALKPWVLTFVLIFFLIFNSMSVLKTI